jgi:hypothetical protein
MNTRRGFFKSLFKAAAIIALAPQIAFRVKPDLGIDTHKLNLTEMFDQACKFRPYYKDQIDIFTDRFTAAKIQSAMVRFYERQNMA